MIFERIILRGLESRQIPSWLFEHNCFRFKILIVLACEWQGVRSSDEWMLSKFYSLNLLTFILMVCVSCGKFNCSLMFRYAFVGIVADKPSRDYNSSTRDT
ncbi:hypothetical protein ACOSQ2_018550 [Xanthoceras sorbifolium]